MITIARKMYEAKRTEKYPKIKSRNKYNLYIF